MKTSSRVSGTWSSGLVEKLSEKAYRVAYVREHVKTWIAYQIRTLREQRNWLQGRLANEMAKPQSVVSRIEDPDYGKLTLQTLFDVAAAFDVALIIKFVDHRTFLGQTRSVGPGDMRVASFSAAALMPHEPQRRSLKFVIRDLFEEQTSGPSRTAQPAAPPSRIRQFTDSYVGLMSIPSDLPEPEEIPSTHPHGFLTPPQNPTPVTEVYSIG